MKESNNLASIALTETPLKVAIARPNLAATWFKAMVVWPCYTMKAFEEFKMSKMPLSTFSSIVWFAFSPFSPEVLSTLSLVHFILPPIILKRIWRGQLTDESPHSNLHLKSASPHDFRSPQLGLRLFPFPCLFYEQKESTLLMNFCLFRLPPYFSFCFCKRALQWPPPQFSLGYFVHLKTIITPT